MRTCSNGGWGVCVGEVTPLSDTDITCDGIDDNCNGTNDEDVEVVIDSCSV